MAELELDRVSKRILDQLPNVFKSSHDDEEVSRLILHSYKDWQRAQSNFRLQVSVATEFSLTDESNAQHIENLLYVELANAHRQLGTQMEIQGRMLKLAFDKS